MDWQEKFRNWWNSTPEERPVAGQPVEMEDSVDPYNPFPEPVQVPLSDVFDLHAVKPDQTKTVVAIYLEDARVAGYRSVRLIHGKGIGVQRATVRSVLATTPFVETFTDAPPEAGGWGATIAFFK
jgi:dsDNA-specific endonuclease/ATPase MutS2